MKIKMSELQRIIKEEIEYALLEEDVELQEVSNIQKKMAGALAGGLTMMAATAGANPVRINFNDYSGPKTIQRHIVIDDEGASPEEVARNMNAVLKDRFGVGNAAVTSVEEASPEDIKSDAAKKPAAKASPAAKSQRGEVLSKEQPPEGGTLVTVRVPMPKSRSSMGLDSAEADANMLALSAAGKSKTDGSTTTAESPTVRKSVKQEGDNLIYKILVK